MPPVKKFVNNLIQIKCFTEILHIQILINKTRFDKVITVKFFINGEKGVNIFNY